MKCTNEQMASVSAGQRHCSAMQAQGGIPGRYSGRSMGHALAASVRILTLGLLLCMSPLMADQAGGATAAEAELQAALSAEEQSRQQLELQAEQSASAAERDRLRAEREQAAEELREQVERSRAEREALIAEAEQARQDAMQAVEASRRELKLSEEERRQAIAEAREELSRAHRELREISREVARAHRELAGASREVHEVRRINLGDRPVIGVLLGEETDQGLSIIGVTPDGPAERAGMQQGDVLTAIGGSVLTECEEGPRSALLKAMSATEEGEPLEVTVVRGGQTSQLTITPERREPSSWHSFVELPDPPAAPGVPGAPHPAPAPRVVIERIKVPELDTEELEKQIREITDQIDEMDFMFIDDAGKTVQYSYDFSFDDEAFSDIGEHAMSEARLLFGLPQTRGLELAELNPELGKYFKADTGVLVIKAREDNAYGLQSGDVITAIGASEVKSPSDLLRALREAEPGQDIELSIKRDRRSRTLAAKVPENRLGLLQMPATSAMPSGLHFEHEFFGKQTDAAKASAPKADSSAENP